jgi:hypothetical protein
VFILRCARYLSPVYVLLVLVEMQCERMFLFVLGKVHTYQHPVPSFFFLAEQRRERPCILRIGIHAIVIARYMPKMMQGVGGCG